MKILKLPHGMSCGSFLLIGESCKAGFFFIYRDGIIKSYFYEKIVGKKGGNR